MCLYCHLLVMQELRNAHSEEIMDIRREEETEKSDEDLEENPRKRLCTHNNNGRIGPKTFLYVIFQFKGLFIYL